jgi:5-methylcytosine-specific restriction enzyme A
LLDYLTANDNEIIDNQITMLDEEEFEMSINYQKEDNSARIEEKMQLVKVRKLDRSICDNLKLLYENRCQITGVNFCENYNVSVVEAHHIDYFVKSQNNNSENIIIISPNYHRLIHKLNPIFDRPNLLFKFDNGLVEKIKLNLHL